MIVCHGAFSWYCLVIWAVIATTASQDGTTHTGMWPKRPLVASGNTLELHCTLPADTTETQHVDDIYFRFNGTSYQATAMADARTATLLVQGARRDMTGEWSCHLPGNSTDAPPTTIGQQTVTVADLPMKPTITGCVVYNWESMTCTWEPKVQDTGIPTNQTLYWTLLRNGPQYWCPSINITYATCTWPSQAGAGPGGDYMRPAHLYLLYMISQNRLGKAQSDIRSMYTGTVGKIVMPNPVEELDVLDTGQTYVVLKWKAPLAKKMIRYKINYNSGFGETNVTAKSRTAMTLQTANITGLEPYTVYGFNISCIPWDSGHALGFWSESQHISRRTAEGVPSAAPGISPGGFRTFDDEGNKRIADIYWQSVKEPDRHGEIIDYRVRYWDTEEEMHELTSEANTVRLRLAKDRAYQVVVEAQTGAGFNPDLHLARLHIEKEADMPLVLTKVVAQVVQDNNVLISWAPIEGATGYTVYWCQGSLQVWTCVGELNWDVVHENTTSWNVSLDDQQYKHFKFGVSAEFQRKTNTTNAGTDLVSSGLVWSQCTHPADKPVSPPQSMKFSKNQKAESITVEWTNPRCENTVYIDKYIIYYCPVTECAEGNEGAEQLNVDSEQEKVTITGLRPTVEYRVWMKSWSQHRGLSTPTKPQAIRVHASGLPDGAIAGIAIVGILVVSLIVYGIYQSIKCFRKTINERVNIRFEPPPDVSHFPDRMCDDQDLHNYQTLLSGTLEQEGTCIPEQEQLYLENGSSRSTCSYDPGTLPPSDTLQTLLYHDSSDSGHGHSGIDSGRHLEQFGALPEEGGLPPPKQGGVDPEANGVVKPEEDRAVDPKRGEVESGEDQESAGSVGLSASQETSGVTYTIPGYSKCGVPEEEEPDGDEVESSNRLSAVSKPTPPTSPLARARCDTPQTTVPTPDTQSSLANVSTKVASSHEPPFTELHRQPTDCPDSNCVEVGWARTDQTKTPSPLGQQTDKPNGCSVANGISAYPIELVEIMPRHIDAPRQDARAPPAKSVNFKHDNNNAYILVNRR